MGGITWSTAVAGLKAERSDVDSTTWASEAYIAISSTALSLPLYQHSSVGRPRVTTCT